MAKIEFFNRNIKDFINSLEKPTFAKTLRVLDLLEKYGSNLDMPHSKKINARLFELRIRGKIEIRILYAYHKGSIVLLNAFVKKAQRLPKKEIFLAKKRLNSLDYI